MSEKTWLDYATEDADARSASDPGARVTMIEQRRREAFEAATVAPLAAAMQRVTALEATVARTAMEVREACAAEAEAAGCLGCWTLEGPLSDHAPGSDHIARCPIALAARLRGLA